ncbi:MAG: glycosyltransferase family 4 protein [Acidimicrobiales bacterium]
METLVLSAPLSISLDVSAIPEKAAGAGQYAMGLVRALDARTDCCVSLVTRGSDTQRWRELAPSSRVLGWAPSARPVRLVWEQLSLSRRVSSLGVDVHHGLHYTMPERAKVRSVVTVHDCTYFDHPEWHIASKVRFFKRAIQVAARRAGAVVCVSDATAERFRELCRPLVPVVVVPHGVDHARFTPDAPQGKADELALARLGISQKEKLIVFVGTIEPRKGVSVLIEAFERLARGRDDLRLVIAGQRGWGDELAALGRTSRPEKVTVTGYVPQATVPALLRAASAVAYPSLDEGFGLPAFEALACGAPLVTSEATPMARLLSDAALLVDPGNVSALAEAIELLVDGDGGAVARREAGLSKVAQLTWAASAQRHLDAYRIAAALASP